METKLADPAPIQYAMKGLIVDDSPTMRRIVCNALREIGYIDLMEAKDGVQALEQIETNSPDFVITGWNMPNMDGIELTRTIRDHPEHGSLPVLMITTRGMQEDVLEAMDARVSDYVVRPFTAKVLHAKIDRILEDSFPTPPPQPAEAESIPEAEPHASDSPS